MLKVIGMKDPLFATVMLIWLLEQGVAVHQSTMRLRVRTSRFDMKPQESFIQIPKSTKDQAIEDYEKVELEKTFIYHLDLYCLCGDPKFCIFFDKSGCIAGIQVSYPKRDVAGVHPEIYNFSNPNFIENNFYHTPAYSVRIYFTNPNMLTEGYSNSTCQNKFDGLWTKLDGVLVRYDAKCQPNSPVINKGEFNMQGCTPKIGLAYIRRFHETDLCQNGFFLYMLYEEGTQVGFGHFVPGRISRGPGKNVLNIPDGPAIEEIMSHPPPCFKEMKPYGLTALNRFLIEDPWNIRCPKSLFNSV